MVKKPKPKDSNDPAQVSGSAMTVKGLEWWRPRDLSPVPYNPNIMTERELELLAASIKAHGFVSPVVADRRRWKTPLPKNPVVVGGWHRVRAAKEILKMDRVPVVFSDCGSLEEERELNVKLNAIHGSLDPLRLMEIVDVLPEEHVPFLGFEEVELEQFRTELYEERRKERGEEDEPPPPPPEDEVVSRPGDLWCLDAHRVLCGDALDAAHVDRLIRPQKPDMVFTDPPYGVSIVQYASVGGAKPFGKKKGWVGGGAAYKIPFGGAKKKGNGGGKGIVQPGRYDEVVGDDSTEIAVSAYRLVAALKIPVLVFWGGNYYANALPPSRCWLIWDKENTGNFADAELAWTNMDRTTRLFRHMWNGLMKASERGEKRVHPTQKPVALAEWAFREFGKEGDTVLDLFLGSASTLIACEQLGRVCCGMEIAPSYVDVAIHRWQNLIDREAILEETGQTFDEVGRERLKKKTRKRARPKKKGPEKPADPSRVDKDD